MQSKFPFNYSNIKINFGNHPMEISLVLQTRNNQQKPILTNSSYHINNEYICDISVTYRRAALHTYGIKQILLYIPHRNINNTYFK